MVLCMAPSTAPAQALPSFVRRGLDQLVAGYPDSAVGTWTWAWAPEERSKQSQLVDVFRQLRTAVGRVLSYDSIRTVDVSPHLKRAYFLLRCENQPVYLLLVLYQPADKWSMSTINVHTNADNVLPSPLFGPEHPRP
jgi:hypothetical protein